MRLIVVVKKNVIKEDLRVKRPFFKNNEKYCTADISALVPYFSPHATYLNMLRNLSSASKFFVIICSYSHTYTNDKSAESEYEFLLFAVTCS